MQAQNEVAHSSEIAELKYEISTLKKRVDNFSELFAKHLVHTTDHAKKVNAKIKDISSNMSWVVKEIGKEE